MKTLKIQIDDQEPVVLTIGDDELTALRHDLQDKDIDQWILHASVFPLQNKILMCGKRMLTESLSLLEAAGISSIPIKTADAVRLVANLPAYKNRDAREAELEVNKEKVDANGAISTRG